MRISQTENTKGKQSYRKLVATLSLRSYKPKL